jgi:2'-5' RNA ligase
MIRLFAALKVPQALVDQAEKLPRKGLDSARWSHPDDLHITLRFLGDVEEGRLPEIEQALEFVKQKKFTVVVKGIDVFRKKHQSILYGAVESARSVTNLSADVTTRLQRIGFEFTAQDYTPHVTLARLKKYQGLPDYVDHHSKKISAEWRAESFFLFRSANPDESGRRYSVIREYLLAAY